MLVHRARAETENLRDVAVGLAARDPQQDLGLALGHREFLAQDRLVAAEIALDQPEQILVRPDLADKEKLKLGREGIGLEVNRRRRRRLTGRALLKPVLHAAWENVLVGVEIPERFSQQPSRLRRTPEDPSGAARRKQKAAERVKRRASAVRDARIGEVDANARQQLAGHERFGDVVNAAGLQTLDDVLGVA